MNRTRRAFTLLEMLISITLFVILALSIYGGINMMKDTNAQLKKKWKILSTLFLGYTQFSLWGYQNKGLLGSHKK
ncbi:MAG: prepilin-type N-terminal cleavage/methylation domain-containing protein [Sulfurovaceae bacterium]